MKPEEMAVQIRRRAFAGTMEDIADLIDAQAAQINALKEKLVEERAANIWAMWGLMHYNSDECAVPSEFIDTLENFNGCTECELESCAAKSWFVADAHQQLKADPDLQAAGVKWE